MDARTQAEDNRRATNERTHKTQNAQNGAKPNDHNKRQTTTDDRRPTTDDRRTTNDDRRPTNDERRTTNDERRTTNDERRTTKDDEQRRRNDTTTIGCRLAGSENDKTENDRKMWKMKNETMRH